MCFKDELVGVRDSLPWGAVESNFSVFHPNGEVIMVHRVEYFGQSLDTKVK